MTAHFKNRVYATLKCELRKHDDRRIVEVGTKSYGTS